MGRAPCCDKANVKKGPWSPEEDTKLKDYIDKFGTGGNWITLPHKAGLKRCGKSCRLRWLNYLRPNIKHGEFSDEEDRIILNLFASIGSRWSIIASQLPGRTDNDIKNYWNTKLKKKLMGMMVPPVMMSHDHHRLKPSTILHFPSPTSSYQTLPSQQPLSLSSSFLRSDNTNSCPLFYDTPNNIDFLTSQFGTFQPQEGNLVNPMQIQGITSSSSSLTMKLLDQSCSSLIMFSDPIKQERVDFQNSSCSGFDQSQQQTDDGQNHHQWSHNNALLDYDLEDVKRLIGSSNSGSGNSNFFSTDNGETRSEEEILSMYNF